MKKVFIFVTTAFLAFCMVSVSLPETVAFSLSEAETVERMPTEKIAIITASHGNERYFSTKQLVAKYGEEKIVHFTKPKFLLLQSDREQKRALFNTIAQDPEIKVLIINPAGFGTDYFVSTLRQQRPDIFIIYIDYDTRSFHHGFPYLQNTLTTGVSLADLILNVNMLEFNNRAPVLAQKLGAKTLVLFGSMEGCEVCGDDVYCKNFVMHNKEARMMHTKSKEIGLNLAFYDSRECQCGSSTHGFMSENMPKIIRKYGKNTVFLGLDNDRLMWYAISGNTFFIHNYRYQSTFSFPHDIMYYLSYSSSEMSDLLEMAPEQFHDTATIPVINETIKNELKKVNMLGRVAFVPYSVSAMFAYVSVEYAIKRFNGEASTDGIDTEILERLMLNYITQTAGIEKIGVDIKPFAIENEIYKNFLLVFPDYLIY